MPKNDEFKMFDSKGMSSDEEIQHWVKQIKSNTSRGRNFKLGSISFKLNGAQVKGLEIEKDNIEREFGMPVSYEQAAVKLFLDRCTMNLVSQCMVSGGRALWELENPEAAKKLAAKEAKAIKAAAAKAKK